MATYYSQGSGAWSTLTNWDTNAGGGGSDPASVAAMDDQTFIIQAGHDIILDVDMSGFANGIAGLTITSHATTPGMLRFKHDVDGTYCVKIKTGTTIAGTNAAAKGRILANSDGVWGNTGALAYGRKAIIDLQGTANISALYLDIALYCYEPLVKSVRVYKGIKDVSSIATATDVITMSAPHGWAAGTAVCVTSSGTLPGGLAEDTVYYVRAASGADLKLALQNSDATIVDITSSGTGTIRLYSGHTDTATATVNVLEDVRAVTGWSTTDGLDYVVLVDANAPENYDQQRLQLTTINETSLVLSANVDSAQYPGARVWLVSRNVTIRSATNTTTNIVDYGTGTHSGVIGCHIHSVTGTGTTFYGTGVNGGAGHTVSGTISGCSAGVSGGTGHTVSGTISGCNTGVNGGSGHTISGTISGCVIVGVNGGTGHTISGWISNAGSYALSGPIGHTISGTISGCAAGFNGGTGCIISGTIRGCGTGISGVGHIVSGTISGCTTGISAGSGILRGATFYGNGTDITATSGTWTGWGATLGGAAQVGDYKHSTEPAQEAPVGVMIQDLGGVSGALGFWTLGGYTKSATYAIGTHGTPPVSTTLIHETTFEDNERICWAEIPVRGVAGVATTVTFYGQLTGTTAWTTLPSIGIYDPTEPWQGASEDMDVATMVSNTDWQTLTITVTPTWDRELRVRVQGVGGAAGGTGTEKLYWFIALSQGSTASGGGGPVVGSRIIRGLGAV